MERSIGSLFLVLTALIFAASVVADDSGHPVDYRPSLLKGEWYSEGWDQLFYFADGTFLSVQFSVVNIGFGSRHGAVLGLLVTPENEASVLKQSRSKGDWTFAEDQLSLAIAEHTFDGTPPHYEIRIRKREGEIDVDFTAGAEPWRIGNTRQIDDDFRYLSFYAPLVSASGRYRLAADGDLQGVSWIELGQGRGFATRYVNSAALNDFIRSATKVVPVRGDAVVQPVIYTSRGTAEDMLGHLALFENGKLIHQLEHVDMQIVNRQEKVAGDNRDIPVSFKLDVEREDFSLQGTIEADRLIVRFDPVDQLKPFVRRIVKILNTPIQYRYLASYDLVYRRDGIALRLQGEALMDHIVMRHAKSEQPPTRRAR